MVYTPRLTREEITKRWQEKRYPSYEAYLKEWRTAPRKSPTAWTEKALADIKGFETDEPGFYDLYAALQAGVARETLSHAGFSEPQIKKAEAAILAPRGIGRKVAISDVSPPMEEARPFAVPPPPPEPPPPIEPPPPRAVPVLTPPVPVSETVEHQRMANQEAAEYGYDPPYPQVELADIIGRLLPGLNVPPVGPPIELTPQEMIERLVEFADSSPHILDETIRRIGRTWDTEALLVAFDFTDEQIDNFFVGEQFVAPPPTPTDGAVTLEGDYIEQGVFESLWDAIILTGRRVWSESVGYFTKTVPNALFGDPLEQAKAAGVDTSKWSPEYWRQVETQRQNNQAMRDKWRAVYAREERNLEEFEAKYPELQPPARYQKDLMQNLDLLKEPGYIAHMVGNMIPYTAAVMATTFGTLFATKNPYLAGAAGLAVATPSVSQDLVEDLEAAGVPESVSAQIAIPVGFFIASIEVLSDLFMLKIVAPGMGALQSGIKKEVVKQTAKGLLKRAGQRFIEVPMVETVEEVAQGITQNVTVNLASDENRAILAGIDETIIKTFITSMITFGLPSAATSLRHVRASEAETISPEQKKTEGWEQDEITLEWYKPEKIADTITKKAEEFEAEGLSPELAMYKALNEAARTPAGEKAIREAYNKVRDLAVKERGAIGVPEEGVTPTPEAKQPWQMTQQEAIDDFLAKRKPTDKLLARTMTERLEMERTQHKARVEQALSEGKPVPAEVLKDYPELAAKVPKVAPPAEAAKPPPPVAKPIAKVPPTAEPGMPEAGIQKPLIPEVEVRVEGREPKIVKIEPKVVRPEAKAPTVQAKLDEYLRAKEWKPTAADTRLKEIGGLLATKGKLPTGMGTKEGLRLEQARLEAQKDVAQATSVGDIQSWIDPIETELGLRDPAITPYHGGKPNKFPQFTTTQLNEMLRVYEEAKTSILGRLAKKPMTSLREPSAEQVAINEATPGQPTLTPEQVTRVLDLFGKYVNAPTTISAWELTLELRRETRGQRAEAMRARAQELIISEGLSAEAAIDQATKETMAGVLPDVKTDYLEDQSGRMRDVLFNKLYQTLKDEPFEMLSTTEALTNALLGKPIPREPGVKGGSAYSRLDRVFGEQPQVMKAIDTMAREKKTLEDFVEGVFHEIGRAPIPVDQVLAEYLRKLSTQGERLGILNPEWSTLVRKPFSTKAETERATELLRIELAEKPTPPTIRFEAPIEEGFKALPMFSFMEKNMIVQVLKELAYSPIDIGNFLRANKASFDQSFLRQARIMSAGHPVMFARAYKAAWKATFSQKRAEAEWVLITRDPDFQIYEEIREATGHDPLRVPAYAGVKGTAQWRTAEEFGFPTQERWIPTLTGKLPHIRLSERGFSTGLNKITWGIWKAKLEFARKYSERIASGQVKLKVGEAFSIVKEMTDQQAMLADMGQRATLKRASGLAPAFNAFFFALRSKMGRFLFPRHLISKNPRVRKEAWKNFVLMNSMVGGIMLLGDWLELWDTEKDPRNAEVMSARIGNIRIDPWAGYRQFAVLYARLATRTGISSVTGAEYDVDPLRALWTFTRSSLSPMAGILLDFWTGRNFLGEVVEITNARQWLERLLPFSIVDVWEAYEEDAVVGTLLIPAAIHGEGIQTYSGDWRDNWGKLGISKYPENLAYGLTEPWYDTKDFWSDTASQFKGVDPETLTEAKGFPPYVKAIAEARIIVEKLGIMPNEKLASLNADPKEGTTFAQYAQMWRDRQAIVASGDEKKLKEFDADERTRSAHLGNFTQKQLSLLMEYHSITDKQKQAEFLEKHKNQIGVNLRHKWLKAHPKENAQLAIWGQAKILTKEAYDEVQRLIEEFDIPETALEFALPPKESIETHFAYEDFVADGKHGSWEAQLLLAKDHAAAQARIKPGELEQEFYAEWHDPPLTISDTPIPALELQVADRELYDQEDLLRETLPSVEDPDDPKYETGYQYAIAQLKEKNPDWVDNQRRIEAIKNNGEEHAESWVERGHVVDEHTGGSSEAKVWLVDNIESYRWALEQGLLTDDGGLPDAERTGEAWNVPVLRLTATWRDTQTRYDILETDGDRDAFKAKPQNQQWVDDMFRKKAYGWDMEMPSTRVEAHVGYSRLEADETKLGAEAKLFLWDDETGYYDMRIAIPKGEDGHLEPLEEKRVPIWRIDVAHQKDDDAYDTIIDEDATKQREARALYLVDAEGNPTIYARQRRERDFYEVGLELDDPRYELKDSFVEYKLKPQKGWRGERYLMNHRDLYKMLLNKKVMGDNAITAIDFSKIPNVIYDDLSEKWAKEIKHLTEEIPNKYRLLTGDARDAAIEKDQQAYLAKTEGLQTAMSRIEAYKMQLDKKGLDMITAHVKYDVLPERGMDKELFLKENPKYWQAMAEAIMPDHPELWHADLRDKHVESLKISVAWAEQDNILASYSDPDNKKMWVEDPDKRRDAQRGFLERNPEFWRVRKLRDGYDKGVPDNRVEEYADYYLMLDKGKPEGNAIWFEDERYLQSHQAFYVQVYLGMFKRDKIDFSKVPSEAFEKSYNKTYQHFSKVNDKGETVADSKARYIFRQRNPKFDAEGVRVGFFQKPVDMDRIFASDKWQAFYDDEYKAAVVGRERYELRGRNPWFDAEGVRLGMWKPYDRTRYAFAKGALERLEEQNLLEEWLKRYKK